MNGRDSATMRKHVTLEHRHFCFIAAVLAEMKPEPLFPNAKAQWDSTVNAFVAACKRSNGRFDADRFIEACNHDR